MVSRTLLPLLATVCFGVWVDACGGDRNFEGVTIGLTPAGSPPGSDEIGGTDLTGGFTPVLDAAAQVRSAPHTPPGLDALPFLNRTDQPVAAFFDGFSVSRDPGDILRDVRPNAGAMKGITVPRVEVATTGAGRSRAERLPPLHVFGITPAVPGK